MNDSLTDNATSATSVSQPDTELPIEKPELAQRLGIGMRTVDRMVNRGELPRPCIGAGGSPRWLWSHVIEFLRARHEREDDVGRRVTRNRPEPQGWLLLTGRT